MRWVSSAWRREPPFLVIISACMNPSCLTGNRCPARGSSACHALGTPRARPVKYDSAMINSLLQDEEYARFLTEAGLKGGVTAPLTMPFGSFAAMTVLSAGQDSFDDQIVRAIPLLGCIALMRIEALGIAKSGTATPKSALKPLSDHQREILHWVAQGKSNGDIAEIIGQKKRTVDYHVKEILKKLGVSTKIQAAAMYSCNDE